MPGQDLTIIGNDKNTLVCLSLIPSSNTPNGGKNHQICEIDFYWTQVFIIYKGCRLLHVQYLQIFFICEVTYSLKFTLLVSSFQIFVLIIGDFVA